MNKYSPNAVTIAKEMLDAAQKDAAELNQRWLSRLTISQARVSIVTRKSRESRIEVNGGDYDFGVDFIPAQDGTKIIEWSSSSLIRDESFDSTTDFSLVYAAMRRALFVAVSLPITRAHNPGEWRLSRVVGNRSIRITAGIPAIGGTYQTELEIGGHYKINVWTNNNPVPRRLDFIVTEDGTIDWLQS